MNKSPPVDSAILAQIAQGTSQAVIITNLEQEIIWVNDSFCRISGYTRDEVMGVRPGVILQGGDTDSATKSGIRRAIRARQSFQGDILNYTKGGVPYWTNLVIDPLRDRAGDVCGFMGVQSDITARKNAEGLARSIFTAAGEAMVVTNCSGLITLFNPAAEHLFGWSAGEVVGRSYAHVLFDDAAISDHLPHWRPGASTSLLQEILSADDQDLSRDARWSGMHQQGTRLPVLMTVTPVCSAYGAVDGYLAIIRDLRDIEEGFAAREQLAAIAVQVPGLIYQFRLHTDESMSMPFVSGRLQRLFGVSTEAVQYDAAVMLDQVYREDQPGLWTSIRQSADSMEPWRAVFRVRSADHGLRWIRAESFPIRESDGSVLWHGYMHDITTEQQREEAIRELTERLQVATDSSGIGIWEHRIADDLLIWDQQMHRLYGTDCHQPPVALCDWWHYIVVEDRERVRTALQRLMSQQGPMAIEFRVHRSDTQETRWIRSRAVLLDANAPGQSRLVGINDDITSRKEGELALMEARDRAEAANRAKSTFLATMSHEIRTPMNGIMGMAQMLGETQLGDEQRSWLHSISQSAEHLLRVINDVLDFSRMEAGKLAVDSGPVNLRDLILSVAHLLRGRIDAQRVALVVDIHPSLPTMIHSDAVRLRQIVMNMMSNAVKFTQEGTIHVVVERNGDHMVLAVRDTGCGIDPHEQQRLFQPFEQIDGGFARRVEGSGLGLVISRRLAKLLQGTLTVESALGAGSTFTLTLPLQDDLNKAAPWVGTMSDLGSKSIILLDDHPVRAQVYARDLTTGGARVQKCLQVEDVIEVLQEHTIDAIVISGSLSSGHNCVSIGRSLKACSRQNNRLRHLPPLIAALQEETSGTNAALAASGYHGYVLTPCLPQVLTGVVDSVLHGHPGMMTAARWERLQRQKLPVKESSVVQLEGVRVLVAEDNAVNQQVALAMLHSLGAEAQCVDNGTETLTQLAHDRPHVLLLDVHMPEKDGFQVIAHIRAQEQREGLDHLPVIAFTANAMQGDRDRCLAAGMDDYISKPLKKDALAETIARCLSGSRQA